MSSRRELLLIALAAMLLTLLVLALAVLPAMAAEPGGARAATGVEDADLAAGAASEAVAAVAPEPSPGLLGSPAALGVGAAAVFGALAIGGYGLLRPNVVGDLGKMLFSGSDALKKPNVLSGGEKVRCMFSKMMLSGANVLILDGPTSHLDLESITAVNEGLARYKGSVIFTSHDHEMIQTVANRIIEIDGGVVYDNHISYEEYLAAKVLKK